jgi:heme/copper-type cytochrome/quinol oxidase subunit 3
MVDVPRTALFSLALWASSGTIWLATRQLGRGNRTRFGLWLLATIGLGVVFLVGQVTEYANLLDQHVTISTNLFTSIFFTLTGFHGFHVVIGLLALSIAAGLAFAGRLRRTAVEAVSIYWHFVDLVWVKLFAIVYLWSLLP